MAPVATKDIRSVEEDTTHSPFKLKPWVEPKVTQKPIEWANLDTIDISLLDSDDPAVKADLIARAKRSLTVDGFLYVVGTGIPPETIQRHMSIAQHIVSGVPDSEKPPYVAKLDEGSYRGYKLRGIWQFDGAPDNFEHYNFETPSFSGPITQHPPSIRPLLPEIRAFSDYTYNHIVRRILAIVSLVLELPENALWDLHDHSDPIGTACQRYMGYLPRSEEVEIKTKGVWSKGHTDYNSISLLWSQPISSLQINEWKYVKHVDGAVVVNVADALDFITGGILKATRHRVVAPPSDQRDIIRYILIHFARARADLVLEPLAHSPLLQREGYVHPFADRIASGGRAPTQAEWLEERIRRTGKGVYVEESKAGDGLVKEVVLGREVSYYV